MDAVLSILLQKGGLLGAIVVALLWGIRTLDARLIEERRAHQLAMQAAQAALQAEHEKRLEDQRLATRALLELNDRVHLALDRAADLIETLDSTTRTRPPR